MKRSYSKMPTVKEIFEAFEKEFVKALAAKTNWGRNEIIQQFYIAKGESMIKLLGEKGAE